MVPAKPAIKYRVSPKSRRTKLEDKVLMRNDRPRERLTVMKYRKILKGVFKPLVVVVAALYFVIDGLVLAALRPLLKRILHLKLFRSIERWIESLGPYSTLAVFLIPLILLEPVKPVSAYLIASGHFVSGAVALVLGEILKILIVERVFHIGRPKLMTIKAFAWTYDVVVWANGGTVVANSATLRIAVLCTGHLYGDVG